MECSFVSHAIALLFTLQLTTSMAFPPTDQTNTDFIKTSCSTTTYPQLCYNTLSSYANDIQDSPKLLVKASLTVTLTTAQSTSTAISNLSKSHGLSPMEASAMSDCVEVLGDAVDELQKSTAEMGLSEGTNWGLQISDIQTWVSAALTDVDTCMDGFAGHAMDGNKVRDTVRGIVVDVAQMISIALALINNDYASSQPIFSP
ncbi:hypothetical protein ACSBR2_037880 [Camellia fascicularis]